MAEEKIIVSTSSKLNSILTAFVAVLAVGLIIVAYFTWKSLREENIKLRDEIVSFKQLTETLVRSSTTWATKSDVTAALSGLVSKEDLKLIQDDLNKIGARLSAVGQTVGSIKARIAQLEQSDREGPERPVVTCEDGKLVDVHGYTKKVQIKEIEDSNKAPMANVQFDAAKDKPWSYEAYRRDYKMITVVGKKDDGQLTFHHQLKYSIPDKDKEKIYNIELLSSDYLQVPLKNQMFWFNPRIDGSMFMGGKIWGLSESNIISGGFDIGLSFSSYGSDTKNSILRFFRFGLGYDIAMNSGRLSFAPLLFNFGHFIPPLSNLYILPQVGIDTNGNISINAGLGAQF